jgi:hypothetical protein
MCSSADPNPSAVQLLLARFHRGLELGRVRVDVVGKEQRTVGIRIGHVDAVLPHALGERDQRFGVSHVSFGIATGTHAVEAGLEVTDTRAFAFDEVEGGLTVKLWAARDPRLLVADEDETNARDERVVA